MLYHDAFLLLEQIKTIVGQKACQINAAMGLIASPKLLQLLKELLQMCLHHLGFHRRY